MPELRVVVPVTPRLPVMVVLPVPETLNTEEPPKARLSKVELVWAAVLVMFRSIPLKIEPALFQVPSRVRSPWARPEMVPWEIWRLAVGVVLPIPILPLFAMKSEEVDSERLAELPRKT
jgi:hypothetical protein